MEERTIHKRLASVQQQLAVPKGNFNTHGKYSYRSAEDIYQALKPLVAAEGLTLLLDDDIELVGERYYVKSTATVTDGKDSIASTAYAREQGTVKGMVEAQTTGAASSYARKYALCGLFLIDGEADPDATNQHDSAPRKAPEPPQKPGRFDNLRKLREEAEGLGIKPEGITSWIQSQFGKGAKDLEDHEIAATEQHVMQLIKDMRSLGNA